MRFFISAIAKMSFLSRKHIHTRPFNRAVLCGNTAAELEMEEKYRESLHRVEGLRDQLTVRRDLTIRAISAREIAEADRTNLEQKLQEAQDDAAAVSAELTRQYKTMQTQMGLLVCFFG